MGTNSRSTMLLLIYELNNAKVVPKVTVVPDQSSFAKQTRCLVSHWINETLFRGGNGEHGLIASAQ